MSIITVWNNEICFFTIRDLSIAAYNQRARCTLTLVALLFVLCSYYCRI